MAKGKIKSALNFFLEGYSGILLMLTPFGPSTRGLNIEVSSSGVQWVWLTNSTNNIMHSVTLTSEAHGSYLRLLTQIRNVRAYSNYS